MGDYFNRHIHQLPLRTGIRRRQFIGQHHQRAGRMGHSGHRHLAGRYRPTDQRHLFTSAADRQRRHLCRGETTSYRQLASTIEHVTQRRFTKNVLTLPALLEALRLRPDDQMLRYRAAFARVTACGGQCATPTMRKMRFRPRILPPGLRHLFSLRQETAGA